MTTAGEQLPQSETPAVRSPSDGSVRTLLDVVRRALLRQSEVERLLTAMRDDEPLAVLAPRVGPAVSEYVALRRELEPVRDPRLAHVVEALAEVLDFHAQVLHHGLRLVGESWRSSRLREQQERLGGIGPQGDRLWVLAATVERLAGSETVR